MNALQKKACGVIATHYGLEKQKNQTYQELSELICVLSRRQDQKGDRYKEQLLDEIADAEIMIEQMRQLHDIGMRELKERIDFKLNRQLARMEGETDDKP